MFEGIYGFLTYVILQEILVNVSSIPRVRVHPNLVSSGITNTFLPSLSLSTVNNDQHDVLQLQKGLG